MPDLSKMVGMKMTGGYDAYKKGKKRKSRGRGAKSRAQNRRRSMKRSRSYKRK